MAANSDAHRFDDLFAEFGPIRLKRFFGGEGIAVDDLMIGFIFSDIIYFKTDGETLAAFRGEKCKPFTFRKHSTGETIETSWFSLPERLYDDPEELAVWARKALAVARAAPEKKRAKTGKGAPVKKRPQRRKPAIPRRK